MKITIATLINQVGVFCVGAVKGELTEEQRHAFAAKFRSEYGSEEVEEEGRWMHFRQVDLGETPEDVRVLIDDCDEGVTICEHAQSAQ